MSDNGPRVLRFRWKTDADNVREAAEAEQLRDDGRLIEHEASLEPSNKD
jgi:hypothetical protein